jgi:hypothetical protein
MLEIVYKKVTDLIPYVNNARVHSEAQVNQIISSMKEFQFTNPILTDGDNGIIAGHGRLMAARKMGMDSVPTVELSTLPKSVIRNGVKDCLCADCGTEFTVRKDTNPSVCNRCRSSRGGKSIKGMQKSERKKCKGCDNTIRASKKDKYCSIECRDKTIKEMRTCKTCSKDFYVLKSTIKNNTNATGNFCSRVCYEKWMCNGDRVTGRGSQWKKTRNESILLQPFCSLCGTNKALQVHHIAPFRLSHDNSQENLIVLCIKHHKIVENITHDIELTGSTPADMKFIIGNILSDYSAIQRIRVNAIS